MGHVRRLIVFDLDGTLIDSRRDLTDSANALIAERGGAPLPEAAVAKMVGEGAAVLVRRALTAAGLPVEDGSVARFLDVYDERLVRHTRPYPGIPEAVAALNGRATLAVLTNKPLAHTRRLLETLDLSRWMTVVLGGDGPLPRKPDPASLRHLMAQHATGADTTVLVGDSRIDFETARAAGTPCLLVRWGFGYDGIPPDAFLHHAAPVEAPADLPAAVDRLFRRC